MTLSRQTQAALVGALLLSGLIMVLWVTAAGMSGRPFVECLELVAMQSMLAGLVLAAMALALPHRESSYGPRLIFVISLHVLLYYGISNVVPALLPGLRPNLLSVRVPASPTGAYSVATVAAILLYLGFAAGARVIAFLWPLPCAHVPRAARPYAWLPCYRTAATSCLSLLVLVVVGTILYGARFDAEMLTGEATADMPFGQQLLFHGLFDFLPVAPILAAAALIQSGSARQRRSARWLLALACLTTFSALLAWGMRSTAMLALALPIALLIYAGRVDWKKITLPGAGLVVIVYGVVTYVRNSEVRPLLAEHPDLAQLSVGQVVSALKTPAEDQGVMARALADASYRTAGLEAVAALLQAQSDGSLPLQWGKTIRAGFLQALPASIRPEFEIPERIKTAPAWLGVFQPGDWVTTLLSEYVLDFGPFILLIPAIVGGLVLAFLDRALLGLGQHSALEGLLILRIAFLVNLISFGGSLADMTLTFLKAGVGYTALFILLAVVGRISVNRNLRSRQISGPPI